MTPDRPRRTCVGCRRVNDPADLTRLARRPDGTLAVGRGPGRGAWVCSAECLVTAGARGALGRALRGEITPAEVLTLREKLDDRRRRLCRPPT
ncbi:MAG: YlxR family protein [Acidimicrobiia bacterium]